MAKKYINSENLKYFYLKLKSTILDSKVDKAYKTGSASEYKVLSDNNYSDTDKGNLSTALTHAKSSHAPSDAQKNVQANWQESDSSSDAYIKNKPNPVVYDVQSLTDAQKAQARSNIGAVGSADIPEGAAASSTSPKMDGTATVGTENAFARGDHIHPKDTSKQDTTNSLTAEASVEGDDSFPFYDSSAKSNRKITWTNILSAIQTYFSTLFASKSHTHGSVTNDGKIGTTGGQVVTTGTDGTLTAKAQGDVTVSFTPLLPKLTFLQVRLSLPSLERFQRCTLLLEMRLGKV